MFLRLTFLLVSICCQLGVDLHLNGGATLKVFHEFDITVYPSSGSPYYPDDFFVNTHIGTTNIYILQSNNVLKIYNKLQLSSALQTFTNYSYANGGTQKIVYVSTNLDETTLILSSSASSIIKHKVLDLQTKTGVIGLIGVYGSISSSTSPSRVFTMGTKIYSYFRSSWSNDSVQITEMLTNTSTKIILACSNCDIEISPNIQTALVWDSSSRVYIYDTTTTGFVLKYTYTGSLTSSKGYTNIIPFSQDNQLAIIETGGQYPVRVLNLTDCTVKANITGEGIYSTSFLDSGNRFVIIDTTKNGVKIYDLLHSQFTTTAYSFEESVRDANCGLIFDYGDKTISCYGVNITDGGSALTQYPWVVVVTSVENITANVTVVDNVTVIDNATVVDNVTNTTSTSTENITENQTPNQDLGTIDPAIFYMVLQYSEAQNQTLTWMQGKLVIVNDVIEKMFTVIFSSPLALQFLSLFNYFMLCSLYVLINMKIPYEVFRYLSLFLTSASGNLLTFFNVQLDIDPLSAERVTDQRPLYFKVSSDIISQNYASIFIMLMNIFALQLLIFLAKIGGKKLKRIRKTLTFFRIDIYWGLLVSNMIPLILPWRYSIWGGTVRFPSKINLLCQYFSVILIPFMVIVSFFHEFRLAKKEVRTNQIKTALREWWAGYQNFIYPLLLLLPNPIFFIVIIGIGNLIALYNSFSAPQWKFFIVLKAIYPLLFHTCFIFFMASTDSFILAVAALTCLVVFLLGSLHNIIESFIVIIYFLWNFIKEKCQKSKENNDQKKVRFEQKKNQMKSQKNIKVGVGIMNLPSIKKKADIKKTMDIKDILKKISDELKDTKSTSDSKHAKSIKSKRTVRSRVKTTKDGKQTDNIVVDWTSKAKVTLVYE